MSARDEAREALEEAEAAIRRAATYMEPHTGRYRCAITEDAMRAILDAIEAYADIRVAGADRTERADARARQRRLAAASASAAQRDATLGAEMELLAARQRLAVAAAEHAGRQA